MFNRLLVISLCAVALPAARGTSQAPPKAPEIIVYASEVKANGLSEFDFWSDPASPGGKMIGTVQKGDHLDPPPENDPNVSFTVPVRSGVDYRCWIHMKVGEPKGVSTANKLFVQFSGAVDKANKEVLRPGTGSYLTAEGPTQVGWAWVACEEAGDDRRGRCQKNGEVTVRLQGGAEGVGFDQFILSPARFVEKAPTEPVVAK
jgi:hypothetical protein